MRTFSSCFVPRRCSFIQVAGNANRSLKYLHSQEMHWDSALGSSHAFTRSSKLVLMTTPVRVVIVIIMGQRMATGRAYRIGFCAVEQFGAAWAALDLVKTKKRAGSL